MTKGSPRPQRNKSYEIKEFSEKEQKAIVDQVAASIILQAWLDHRIGTGSSPEKR